MTSDTIILRNERDEQFAAIRKQFDCSHSAREVRLRTVAGGGKQRVWQCLSCGLPQSNPLKLADAMQATGGEALKPFDDDLESRWTQEFNRQIKDATDRYQEQVRSSYGSYLESSAWDIKRRAVLARCRGRCEGCAQADAVEVHHLSYEHVGAEFLFELVGVCSDCHDRLHEDSNNTRAPSE